MDQVAVEVALPGQIEPDVLAALGDGDAPVVHVDLPLTGPVDVEEVRVAHPRGLRPIDSALQRLEELSRSGHGAEPSDLAAPRNEERELAWVVATRSATD